MSHPPILSPAPALSVVIPLLNESGNIAPLLSEIAKALKNYPPVGENFEIIAVNDGSTDSTAAELEAEKAEIPQLRPLTHPERLGMSAAIRNGVRRARSSWVMTIDGDRQNDPADMPRLLNIAWESGKDRKVLVAGIRVNRQDTKAKRLASKFANAIRRACLNDNCPDTGCSLKLFHRETYLELPFFNGLHRFMPALFKLYGHDVFFSPVNDRLRTVGLSKSDFSGRAIRGLFDLLGVIWLIKRTPAPDKGEEN